jgi:hypothetical protein
LSDDPYTNEEAYVRTRAAGALARASSTIYAELAIAFDRTEDLEAQRSRTGVRVASIPREA